MLSLFSFAACSAAAVLSVAVAVVFSLWPLGLVGMVFGMAGFCIAIGLE